MRTYILTKKEEKILEKWLETGEELPGYPTLKTRIMQNFFTLSENVKLLVRYLIRIENNLPTESREHINYIAGWIITYLRDIAPDKIPDLSEISERFNKQSALLNAALNNSPEAILILDKSFNIVYVNEAFTRLSGRSWELSVGRSIGAIYDGIDYSEFARQLRERGRLESMEPVKVHGKDDEEKWVEFNASAIRRNGEVVAYTAGVRDATKRKALEGELQRILDRL